MSVWQLDFTPLLGHDRYPTQHQLVENWPMWLFTVAFSHPFLSCSSHLSARRAGCTQQPSGLLQTNSAGSNGMNYRSIRMMVHNRARMRGIRYNFHRSWIYSNFQYCCSLKAILRTSHKNRSCSARLVNIVTMTSLVLLDRKCAWKYSIFKCYLFQFCYTKLCNDVNVVLLC